MTRKWIPNLLTVINLSAGVVAIILAFAGKGIPALALILGAALFDSLDGRIARRLNVASPFGKELDSLADLISFGVAPATLAYLQLFLHNGWSGYILAALFPVCGALRLARFNVMNVKGHFIGMPITVAGPILAGIAVFTQELPSIFHVLILLFLGGLMISTIRVPKL